VRHSLRLYLHPVAQAGEIWRSGRDLVARGVAVTTSAASSDSETERSLRQSAAGRTRNYQRNYQDRPVRAAEGNEKALLQIGRGLSVGRAERI
jgi:hypothetical protein